MVTVESLTDQLSQDQTAINELTDSINQLRAKGAELQAELESANGYRSDQDMRLNECVTEISSLVSMGGAQGPTPTYTHPRTHMHSHPTHSSNRMFNRM